MDAQLRVRNLTVPQYASLDAMARVLAELDQAERHLIATRVSN